MKKKVLEKLAILIAGAFTLVAALAWDKAIHAIFEAVFGVQTTIIAMVIYAIVVTIIAAFAIVWLKGVSEKVK